MPKRDLEFKKTFDSTYDDLRRFFRAGDTDGLIAYISGACDRINKAKTEGEIKYDFVESSEYESIEDFFKYFAASEEQEDKEFIKRS